MSVAERIKLKRLDMAKEMLQTTSLPVTSIASKLGFGSTLCLYQIFEKTTGLSPEQLRSCN